MLTAKEARELSKVNMQTSLGRIEQLIKERAKGLGRFICISQCSDEDCKSLSKAGYVVNVHGDPTEYVVIEW